MAVTAAYQQAMPVPRISRRSLIISGGVGVGLVVGYALWPRSYPTGMGSAPGEHILSAFVRVGEDGHIVVAVPQVELGHGVMTTHAQIVADELGADWGTVGVEIARAGPLSANTLYAREWIGGAGSAWPAALIERWATNEGLAITGGSTSVRGYETRLRDAGAMARALLCVAAAARWDADWRACETHDGFVWRGEDRMRFGEIAAEAAKLTPPKAIGRRDGSVGRLVGQPLPRLDLPGKVDGSVNYAADIRLPGMVFASISEGPVGDARLKAVDGEAARRVAGFLDIVETDTWVATVATNWWAANEALRAARPRFTAENARTGIDAALDAAFADGAGQRFSAVGDVGAVFAGAGVFTQRYTTGPVLHAPVETASVTVSIDGDGVQVWMATQAPSLAAATVARALTVDPARVFIHAVMVGGSFGARIESDLAAHAAVLAARMKRPVQLTRSRTEETRRDLVRAPAQARLAARTAPDGRIAAWFAQIAAPATASELRKRLLDGASRSEAMAATRDVAEPAAIAGAVPPYDIPIHAIDHLPAACPLPTGEFRARMDGPNCFFRESFIDELAHMTGNEPFGYRMGMLGGMPRLAQCLTRAAAAANWQGGIQGSNQGLACHAMAGGYIAVVAQARIGDDGRVAVDRLVAVADVGRVINPDVVRAQIIGGLVFGMATATAAEVDQRRGLIGPARYGDLQLPRLADCPAIDVELIASRADPGGASELAVPPVAPAIAGALFAATGVRYRKLPLVQDR